MFNYPQLEAPETSRDNQQEFGGYNHNIRISDYEFFDEKNMTSDSYPVLSPRPKRGHIQASKKVASMICKGKLCVLSDNSTYSANDSHTVKLYINNEIVTQYSQYGNGVYFTPATQSHEDIYHEHKMISVGAYLIIFQKLKNGYYNSGWFINTENLSEYGNINRLTSAIGWRSEVTGIEHKVCFSPCTREGDCFVYGANQTGDKNFVHVGVESPDTTNIRNGFRWLDISGDTHYLKVWSKSQSMWTTVNTTFIKIFSPQNSFIFDGFKKGDAVKIKYIDSNGNNIWEIDEYAVSTTYDKCVQQISDLQSTIIIEDIASDGSWIMVSGMLDRISYMSLGYGIRVSRELPYMDFVCEGNNRIWGCRYGLNREGEFVNEIYACKQGDFKNWAVYQGISTDSYAASVGSDESFTGCIAYQNNVFFFKEHYIHKLFGSMPSNYQIQELKLRGVQKGSENSLCLINETLFYKSCTDVCYFDGTIPVSISEPLGNVKYKNAIFGNIKSKLYVNMQDESGDWHLFTYDIDKGLWHKEDNIHITAMCVVGNELYYADSDNNIGSFTGAGTLEDDFKWYAESGPIGYSLPDNKYIGRMTIRLFKPKESNIRVLIKYDDDEDWNSAVELNTESGTKSFSVPIIPRRCDHFRIRIEGKGDCKIYSLCKTIEIGSDEYVY